jgi:hypothetical protein
MQHLSRRYCVLIRWSLVVVEPHIKAITQKNIKDICNVLHIITSRLVDRGVIDVGPDLCELAVIFVRRLLVVGGDE